MDVNVLLTEAKLAELLEVASYCNNSFTFDYHSESQCKTKWPNEYMCFNDKCAHLLFKGEKIDLNDLEAEDRSDYNGPYPHKYVEEEDYCYMSYPVSLKDVNERLSRSASSDTFVLELLIRLEKGDIDMSDAYSLVQVMMFGEIIY